MMKIEDMKAIDELDEFCDQFCQSDMDKEYEDDENMRE